jgi:hypothetical protein
MKRKALWLAVALAAVLGLWLAAAVTRDSRYRSNFDLVHRGMSRDRVIALMEHPSKEGSCGDPIGGRPPTGCALEVRYANSFAPLDPEYYVIWYDQRRTVVDSAFIGSP